MSADWVLLPLEELLLIKPRNGLYKSKNFQGQGNRWVKMKEVYGNDFFLNQDTEFIDVTDDEMEKFGCMPGDLLFGRTSLILEGIGDCLLVGDVLDVPIFESNLFRIRFDLEKADSLFYYYFFKSSAGRALIQTIAKQTAATSITSTDLIKLDVPYPPLDIQSIIAQNINAFDKKIELNHQINQTLESISQAIFKSWFINFDPVKAKIAALESDEDAEGVTRAAMRAISGKTDDELDKMEGGQPEDYAKLKTTAELFPAAMHDSELGEVPEGWQDIPFSKLASLDTTSVKPHNEPDKLWEHYSIPAFDANEAPNLELGSEIKSNKYKVNPTATLSSKLNPNTPRTWWPDVGDETSAICSTEFMQFVPTNVVQRAFIFGLITSDVFQSGIKQRVTGSTGSRQRAQPRAVAEMDVIKPKEELVLAYCSRLTELYVLKAKNIKENITLSKLRDTLLPKLLSGELSVDIT